MVSPRETGVNLFTLTSLTSYDQAERLLPTFINVFFLFLHEKAFVNVFNSFLNVYYIGAGFYLPVPELLQVTLLVVGCILQRSPNLGNGRNFRSRNFDKSNDLHVTRPTVCLQCRLKSRRKKVILCQRKSIPMYVHFARAWTYRPILSSSSFLLSSFFSSPNLSGRMLELDVYHTSTHGVAIVRI